MSALSRAQALPRLRHQTRGWGDVGRRESHHPANEVSEGTQGRATTTLGGGGAVSKQKHDVAFQKRRRREAERKLTRQKRNDWYRSLARFPRY